MLSQVLSRELASEDSGVYWTNRESKGRLHAALEKIYPTSTKDSSEKEAGIFVAARYHKYKNNYVKNLCFDPDSDNLSKWLVHTGKFETYFQLQYWNMHH